jgi:hypothetical protein
MAFELIEKYRVYKAKSTDTKLTNGIQEGSWLFETDSDKKFIFDGESWKERADNVKVVLDGMVSVDAGFSTGQQILTVIGRDEQSGSTEEVVSPITKTFDLNAFFPTESKTYSFASESTEDSFSLDTGVTQIAVIYLNDDYEIGFSVFNTNGQTPVSMGFSVYRILAIDVWEYASTIDTANGTTFAKGNIWFGTTGWTNGIPSDPYRALSNSFTTTRDAIFTVPGGIYTSALFYRVLTSVDSNKASEFNIYVRTTTLGDRIWYKIPSFSNTGTLDFTPFLTGRVPSGTDILVTATPESTNSNLTAQLQFLALTEEA